MTHRVLWWVVVSCLLMGGAIHANQVSYQGVLTNAAGDSLLTGLYDFSFSVFSTETGGAARWTEAHPDVSVQNGIYTVLLGSSTALPDSIGATNWLQITVEGTTLSPRLPINADFRAIEATRAENADSVSHFAARSTPTPNHLLPLNAAGKFPEAVLPFTLDSILAGQGLTGTVTEPGALRNGRNPLDERLTLNVGAGTGINVTADQVSATLGTSISTTEIEDNAVTSAKVLDNSLAVADIAPSIVSSVDSVFNDGGNIDLIAGANITITPNDVNNTITFSATGGGGGYSAGRCIALAGTVIDNTMEITTGDSCIRVVYDPATCTYQLSSDLDVYAGNCIEVEYDDVSCDWTVSVDPACVDSIFDTELYAESFVVIGDGTPEEPRGHLRNDGGLEMRDGEGNEVYLNPNGTMVILQDGEIVGGFDANGEAYAKSFMVIDPETGDTLSHLNNQGGLELYGEDGAVFLNPNGTMVMLQNGEVVGGFDPNGEYYARSFMVIDSTGDTLSHLTNDGGLVMEDNGFTVELYPGGLSLGDSAGDNGVLLDYEGFVGVYSGGTEVITLNPYSGEINAKSFEVRDSTNGAIKAHLDNDGNLALPDGAQITIGGVPVGGGEGDTIRRIATPDTMEISGFGFSIFSDSFRFLADLESLSLGSLTGQDKAVLRSDGCIESYQDGEKVAGVDASGEIFARSFYVLDESGDTLLHLDSGGFIRLGENGSYIDKNSYRFNGFENRTTTYDPIFGLTVENTSTGNAANVSDEYISVTSPDGGVVLDASGTWTATQNGQTVAALDSTGEIIARSFEVRDSVTGATKAHLTNDGNLELPEGAQVLIGGVPIGGGGVGDEIQFEDGSNSSFLNAEGLGVENGTVSNSAVSGTNVAVANDANTSYMDMQYDGTWEAKQNGVIVAGLQPNGEIHAKSFEVRDSLSGAIKAHLTNSGGLTATGTISGQYVTGTTSVYSQSINGNTTLFSDLSPGSLRTQNLLSNVQQSGWTFFNNGTMTQWVDPPGPTLPMLNMQTTADGYWQFGMPVFFGNAANFNYLTGGTTQQGIMTSGNFTINGKANVTGAVDPIICELFPAHPDYTFAPGTVVVADRNTDYVIPCHDVSQTGVIGVVTPGEVVDERGHIMVTILGYAAAFRTDGTRLEMRVKADAKYGAIKRGDLLTTSPTSGYAMVASDPRLGTIVGKALESLDSGTGDIKIMVTLQ